MIDLCKLFGVEEGEEFRVELDNVLLNAKYRIKNNIIEWSEIETEHEGEYCESSFPLNDANRIKNIIKLPKKKEFTDDELAIMRSLPKEYEWIARDDDGELYIFDKKPKNINGIWDNYDRARDFDYFNHLFQNITTEDEEPVFIDDYVERGAE